MIGRAEVLLQSPHRRLLPLPNGLYVLYHKIFGNPLIIGPRELAIYDQFAADAPRPSSALCEPDRSRVIETFETALHLIPPNLDERKALDIVRSQFRSRLGRGEQCNALSLVVTEACNFRCAHCLPDQVAKSGRSAADGAGHGSSNTRMTIEVATKAIDEFLVLTRDHEEQRQIYFGGREPLMNWKVVRAAIEHAHRATKEMHGKRLQYIMFSNCSLLTPEIVDFLSNYCVYVASSMDGPKLFNDRQRLLKARGSAYDAALNGWRLLRDAGLLVSSFNFTLRRENLEVVTSALLPEVEKWGKTAISINPDETDMTREEAAQFASQIFTLYQLGKRRGIEVDGQWRMVFDNLFRNAGNSINTGFCSAYTGHSITVRPGGLYSLCSSDPRPLGGPATMRDFVQSQPYTDKLLDHYAGNIPFCRGCNIEGFCMGGCGVANDMAIRNGLDGTAKCEFFRRLFDDLLRDVALDRCREIADRADLPLALSEPRYA